jgi:hypothetical protein
VSFGTGTTSCANAAAAAHAQAAARTSLARNRARIYFLPKSTFGGSEIAFSFSTVKAGFSL